MSGRKKLYFIHFFSVLRVFSIKHKTQLGFKDDDLVAFVHFKLTLKQYFSTVTVGVFYSSPKHSIHVLLLRPLCHTAEPTASPPFERFAHHQLRDARAVKLLPLFPSKAELEVNLQRRIESDCNDLPSLFLFCADDTHTPPHTHTHTSSFRWSQSSYVAFFM